MSVLFAHAQNKYSGKIINSENLPIIGATIQSKKNLNNAVISDLNGQFSIENNSEVIIKHIGYKTIVMSLNSDYTTIILEENDELLNEVVISASRELQRRKEVPASITVITKKDLKTAKAFGIDQLVNNVPGVLMSTSRAASNEQHFMSVRSPISTKSLFLYIEDGLPIRPTAVFNHNALLEMNDVAFNRVEVIKGPASSIYGSEAIGGSFNFITKNPTKDFTGSLDFQTNDLGLKRYAFEASQYANKNVGFYIGTQYVNRKNGPVSHSDYEKFAITFKNVNHLSSTMNWSNTFHIIDYRSDMTGSLSEEDYNNGNYESDQTFTERDAFAFRFKSTLDKTWNASNKTVFNFSFRKNEMSQNPSYRIRQFRQQGQLTGFGSGELNNDTFYSYVGLIQHKKEFNFANSSLIIGATTDFSPQKYIAETLDVTVNPLTGQNTDFTLNSGDFILNYKANILNYATYFQYEINPIEKLKITAALRYDKFDYDYNNQADGIAGPKDSKNSYDNISPKLGANYNLNKNLGVYANYSNGFTPPQTSTLYRNSFVGVGESVFDLKPSTYDNFEVGTYTKVKNITLDVALYLLNGKNTLVTLRDENDAFFNANAGETRSYGLEYGVSYKPISTLEFSHNGSFAKHEYISFFDDGVDYSNTDRETSPKLLGTTKVSYNAFKNFNVTLSHELVGAYNTSFENQVSNDYGSKSTATYDGHNIFNALVSYKYKSFDVWLHALNLFDDLYSARASYNRFRGENSYTIGNPRAFHVGVKYNF